MPRDIAPNIKKIKGMTTLFSKGSSKTSNGDALGLCTLKNNKNKKYWINYFKVNELITYYWFFINILLVVDISK